VRELWRGCEKERRMNGVDEVMGVKTLCRDMMSVELQSRGCVRELMK